MTNKKGFTLIELLAVIAILAIILLIAVPMVLDVISDSKVKAAKSSAQFAWDAAVMHEGKYMTDNGGSADTTVTYAELSAFLNGTTTVTASTDWTFDANGNVTTAGTLTVNGYTCTFTGNVKSGATCS